MPGLINKETQCALPLSVSDITCCVRGYTLALTASMTYENIEDHAIEGIFIYPLEENSIVVGFEAMICSQIITLQVKGKAKLDDCFQESCHTLVPVSGNILMDEDFERTVLVVNLGLIPPMETVHILVSTSSELTTLPSGGIRVSSPPVCTPRVPICASSPHDQNPNTSPLWLATLLEEEAINSMDYEFNFQLEIRAPYLLAGVESPSHAIRADADPLARSATSVVITLADKYTYDCPVEILIYPSASTPQTETAGQNVDVIHRRLHKDILHNPVVMLNFCPDLKSICSDLRKVHGEFIFLIDRSGSMSGLNIHRVKDAMVVILKSLVPGCLFNIVGFGSTFKSLFTTSQNYEEETSGSLVPMTQTHFAGLHANKQLFLQWVKHRTKVRGFERKASSWICKSADQSLKVLRFLFSCRCFTFGIGQHACRRLVQGLAAVSKGTAEFLADGERPQPKMIKSLKKTMSPVLSDISIEWLFPETKEVLLSPVGNTFLFPGDRLIGYSVVCDTTRYHDNPKSDKRRRYSMMRSVESASSVFYHSQEDENGRHHDLHHNCITFKCVDNTYLTSCLDDTSPRRRAYSTNQLMDYNPAKKTFTPSDPNSVAPKNPLRRSKVQDLTGQMSPEHEAQWKNDYQVCLRLTAPHPHGPGGPDGYGHQLCQAETPQDTQKSYPGTTGPRKGDCKAVVSGLLCGQTMKWEVVFDIDPFLSGREREEKVHEELWNETFHHLAGSSIIQDFEHMAEKECEIEQGSGRKYQVYAIHTSKACNILSKYTAFVPIDLDTNEYLPTCVECINSGELYGSDSPRSRLCFLFDKTGKGKQNLEPVRFTTLFLRTLSSFIFAPQRSPSVTSDQSLKSVESLFSARLALSRTRLLTRAAKGFMCRSHSKSGDSIGESENENKDYIPLVLLQLASGAFPLDSALCEAINVPMEKLRWTSPFASHRSSLGHLRTLISKQRSTLLPSRAPPGTPGRMLVSPPMPDPENMVWATCVALAWLEHSSASYFTEWELVAAKASMWLNAQDIPEGKDLASIKAAANQLFIILRHWDENLQLNMLCYNPNTV
uniref:von Willebrand factor A domain containing 5B1 n=1 Tax=Fundulus heteroclitus TaxID=8078 RepID=A0A3Q2P380_FUNHE